MRYIQFVGSLYELRRYRTAEGSVPYTDWLNDLDDAVAARVQAYVDRMKTGNFGVSKLVGEGVSELKLDFGPGYRVYYMREGNSIIILFCGGQKRGQQSDIHKAHEYAIDYRRRK